MFIKNTDLKKHLAGCTDEQLQDIDFVEDMIKNVIGVNLNMKNLKITGADFKLGGMKMKQYPNEFAQYMCWLYKLMKKKNLKNYLCIGPENGGEFFTVDSLFRRINPNFTESICIDIKPSITFNNFEMYKQQNNVKFIHANSHNLTWDHIPMEFADFCFIDGDHSYEGVKQDFEMVKDHCKYVAFHDTKLELGRIEVYKFWNEIKEMYPNNHWEFNNTKEGFPVPVGIGVVKLR